MNIVACCCCHRVVFNCLVVCQFSGMSPESCMFAVFLLTLAKNTQRHTQKSQIQKSQITIRLPAGRISIPKLDLLRWWLSGSSVFISLTTSVCKFHGQTQRQQQREIRSFVQLLNIHIFIRPLFYVPAFLLFVAKYGWAETDPFLSGLQFNPKFFNKHVDAAVSCV